MSERQPPRLAEWLLRQFYFVERNPALTGDLAEMFEAGRSRGWYWRQTLAIVARGLARNAWNFREYLGAQFLGWLLQAAVVMTLANLHWPHPVHGIWRLFGVLAVVVWMGVPIASTEVKIALFGATSWSLQMLSRYDWAARQQLGRLLALTAAAEFAFDLTAYFALSAWVALSPEAWLFAELIWLSICILPEVWRPESPRRRL